ncbi:MAG: ABC transporter ATP-binding protein, partial [Planctomycetota bacterium]
MPSQPSRQRFQQYRSKVRQRRNGAKKNDFQSSKDGRNAKKIGERDRRFFELFKNFWKLIAEHRATIYWALGMLTISIGLRLIPPLGTKLAIDCVLTKPAKPLPAFFPSPAHSQEPLQLLFAIAGAVV